MSDALHAYLTEVNREYQTGIAAEHAYRPALKNAIEAIEPAVIAVNDPRRAEYGAPDYVVARPRRDGLTTLGYIEAKDLNIPLNKVERTEQFKRYLDALPNLVLTDYLEFRWYVDGEKTPRQIARLASLNRQGKLIADPDGIHDVAVLLQGFLNQQPLPIATPEALAQRLARLAHLIRDVIANVLEKDSASETLLGWRKTFSEVLIAEYDQPNKIGEFADMIAQTLAYGLFSARIMDDSAENFTRAEAKRLIPKTNPFLRKFFEQLSGTDLDDEPYVGFVDDLIALLAETDMDSVLENFGKRTKRQDPIVHFYETFLAAYDPKLREARGVYYTPAPVVSYIVRAVDHILKRDLGCKDGLAQEIKPTPFPARRERGAARSPSSPNPFSHASRGEGEQMPSPRGDSPLIERELGGEVRLKDEGQSVLILDPACGTGTFLYSIIDHIRAEFKGNAGMWRSYVTEHLLPRLFGFELLMTPYAVAHFKLGLQLTARDLPPAERAAFAFDIAHSPQRIGIYLTNSLETLPTEQPNLPMQFRWFAEEALAADSIKRSKPIMVVIGNPPYSGHSANKSAWINGLLKGKLPDGSKVPSYYEVDGKPLGERNPKWLQDDYVKFIRFGQWRIQNSGRGVLAFITNNSFLDNPTFRGMRQALLNAFSDIYILNLHGNSKKKEKAPDGSKDENVFDIQQGVCISLFIKREGAPTPAKIHYADLWGSRKDKYAWLDSHEMDNTDWQTLAPSTPFYLFVPQNTDLRAEYEQGWKVTDIFPVNSVGIVTARDDLTIQWTENDVLRTIRDFESLPVEEARSKYDLGRDVRDWKVSFAQDDLRAVDLDPRYITPILYRPYDVRYTYYTGKTRGFICMPRAEVMQHMLAGRNLGLIYMRQVALDEQYSHFSVSCHPVDNRSFYSNRGIMSFAPLYLYLDAQKQARLLDASPFPPDALGRVPNLNPQFVAALLARITPIPQPLSPHAEKGEQRGARSGESDSPSPFTERGLGGEVDWERGLGGEVDWERGLGGEVDWERGVGGEVTPESIFHYAYAVFHSPHYRARYAEFLKIDYPRLPLPKDRAEFERLAALGAQLVALHLLEAAPPHPAKFPVAGENAVADNAPRYEPISERVYINATQYFEGVPREVWAFQVGGYQVCEKWLKDRRGRVLSYADCKHYGQIVGALAETRRIMAAIDSPLPFTAERR
ncbi:MAG: hypothetical protein OHK0023_13830 [Anaerolineae bacterium]